MLRWSIYLIAIACNGRFGILILKLQRMVFMGYSAPMEPGKSTTMNIMCGVLKQTEGDVYIKGISISKNPVEAKRHIGFLPQVPPLHPDLTVEEYLEYCAELRHIPDREVKKAIQEVMVRCGISHFAKRVIHNLSGGYQQRVGIAQAIIHNPELVIFDEPTNGLDPNQIVEIRHLIKEIAEERTVILSTHILTEVQATCDYIRMIEQGSMVFPELWKNLITIYNRTRWLFLWEPFLWWRIFRPFRVWCVWMNWEVLDSGFSSRMHVRL